MTRVFLILASICVGVSGWADIETTTVLPTGVLSSKFVYGTYSGLDQRYDAVGLLEGVADQYEISLTGSALAKLDPSLETLVSKLNLFSSNEQFGNELNMGTLQINSTPVVNSFVPELDYGLTSNFSIGLGIPIIHFTNSMSISSAGGNLQQLSQFLGNASGEATSALNQLVAAAQNMNSALNGILAARGYLPIRNVDMMAVGDLQISGIYNYYNKNFWHLALRPFIEVPTGQQDNPDDLMDIPMGGQPAVGLYSIHDYALTSKVTLLSSVGYQANIQDTARMRVPTSVDDVLPGTDREDTVQRKTGNSVFFETGASIFIYHPLEFRALYDFTEKDPDWYAGDKGWNYSILGIDTGSQIHQIRAMLEFSAVDWYRKNIVSFPFIFGYIYGNTLYAVNAPDEISHQLYLRTFF